MNDIEPPPQINEFNWIWQKWFNNFYAWTTDNLVKDYGLEVSKGNVSGVSSVNKFGRNIDVDTAIETVWGGGGVINYSATADITHIVSSSSSDTFELTIVGLDTNWNEVTQTKDLTGTTGVALDTALIRVYRMYNSSGTAAVGTIQCGVGSTTTSFTAGNLRAQITIGYEQTLMAVYSVPLGKTAYLANWYAEVNKASGTGAVDFSLFARRFGGVFRIQATVGTQTTGSSNFDRFYSIYPSFPAKTDIEVRAAGSAVNFDVSAGFDLFLVDT